MAELNRVEVTDAAADLLRDLTGTYGPLMFHQSGGCCDGSSPMCYPDGDFITSEADVLLGQLEIPDVERPVSFWMSASISHAADREAHPPRDPGVDRRSRRWPRRSGFLAVVGAEKPTASAGA